MTERLLALFAFLVLLGYLGILVFEVPRLDLGLIVAVTQVLVIIDFFRTVKKCDE